MRRGLWKDILSERQGYKVVAMEVSMV